MIEAALYTLLIETEQATELLPATKVIEYFTNMAKYDNRFSENLVGKDESGKDIYSYSFGNGPHNCLFCAFPEPDAALGGRGIIALANLLQAGACNFKHMPITWHFIPCLNFAHYSEKKANRCLSSLENATLLKAANQIKPCFTFAMHDEVYANKTTPSYLGVTRRLATKSVKLIKTVFARCGVQLSNGRHDPEMGDGFFLMDSIGPEPSSPIVAQLANHGQVITTALDGTNNLKISDLVFLQLAAGLITMDAIIKQP